MMRRLLVILALAGMAWSQTTVTKAPTSDVATAGSSTAWTPGTNRYTVVATYPDTVPTDVLVSPNTSTCATPCSIVFGYSAFTIPSTATSISVAVLYHDQDASSGTNNSQGALRVGTTVYNAGTHNPSTTLTAQTATWANNPATAAAWTPAQVNGTDGTNPLNAFGFYSTDYAPAINYSDIQLAVTYTLPTVATPTFDNDTGSYVSSTTVTISDATSGSAIRYCTGAGADCTPSSSYTTPIAISVNATHLCADATKTDYNNSAIKCATYTITAPGSNWSKWNNVTVGGSAGNIAKWNNVTIGTTASNLGQWNTLLSPTIGGGGGGTVIYSSNCAGSANSATGNCTWAGGTPPSAGQQVAGVLWLPNGSTLTGVCDGTGTGGCTGSSTYTLEPIYSNSTNFRSYVFFTCNYAGTSTTDVTLTFAGASQFYVAGISASGGTAAGCNDGYNKAQLTTAGTAYQSGTVTTTNANDLLVGFFTNDCGVASFTAGGDGNAHTYTKRIDQTLVSIIETLGATATGTYYAAGTAGSSCPWNAEILAIK